MLLFARFETFVKEGAGMKKNKAVSSGKRIAYPYGQAAFDAKTRFKMPESFDFSILQLISFSFFVIYFGDNYASF